MKDLPALVLFVPEHLFIYQPDHITVGRWEYEVMTVRFKDNLWVCVYRCVSGPGG